GNRATGCGERPGGGEGGRAATEPGPGPGGPRRQAGSSVPRRLPADSPPVNPRLDAALDLQAGGAHPRLVVVWHDSPPVNPRLDAALALQDLQAGGAHPRLVVVWHERAGLVGAVMAEPSKQEKKGSKRRGSAVPPRRGGVRGSRQGYTSHCCKQE